MDERRIAGKIAAPEAARERIETWRRQGLAVTVVGGAFDLIGAEHSEFLAAARRDAARLVVVLEDEPGRPGPSGALLDRDARAILVASVRAVDLVVAGGARAATPEAVASWGAAVGEAAPSATPARAPSSARLRARVVAAHERTR